MVKSNWACTSCGNSFGRKSSAKRHVNRVHQGFASYVPWTEYMAGRRTGLYLPGEPPTQGTPKRVPTYFERMEDIRNEAFFDEWGRILARQALTPTSFKLPTFARSTPYVATPYFGDNIFCVESYICSNCLLPKAGTICFIEGAKGGTVEYRLNCPSNTAKDPFEFGSNKEEFLARAKKSCINVLVASVVALMGNQPELIAIEVDDPNQYMGQIIFLKTDSAGKIFSVTLDYSDEKCKELDAFKTGSWAVRAITNGRTILNSSELSEFLGMTETVSYGFFRLNGKPSRTFLLAVVRNGSDNAKLHLQEDKVQLPENDMKDASHSSKVAVNLKQ